MPLSPAPPSALPAAPPSPIEDLRFTIGLYFALVSLILIIAGLSGHGSASQPRGAARAAAAGVNLNLWAGLAMAAFAALMLGMFLRARRREGAGS